MRDGRIPGFSQSTRLSNPHGIHSEIAAEKNAHFFRGRLVTLCAITNCGKLCPMRDINGKKPRTAPESVSISRKPGMMMDSVLKIQPMRIETIFNTKAKKL